MIKVNATTHTVRGVTIATGSVLCVTPHFLPPRRVNNNSAVEHDISFDVAIYKSMSAYEAGNEALTNERVDEYNIGFTASNVDIHGLTSVDELLQILADHIENGDTQYPGVGVGNTEIVYPYSG